MTALRVLSASAALVLGAALFAGCTASDDTVAATSAPTTAATESSAPDATTAATPTPAVTTDEDLTCETMIPSSVVSALTEQGWTATESTLSVGSQSIEDSLVCTWAPTGSFEGQMYGVGRLTAEQENQLRSDLEAQGWTSEEASQGVYFSAPVATGATPTPGATATSGTTDGGTMDGFTYLLGDGWVKYADTRDGILLIVTPVG